MSPDEQSLLRCVLESPADDMPRRAYADWLQDRGDPRGEFIGLQLELAALPTPPRIPGIKDELGGCTACSWGEPGPCEYHRRALRIDQLYNGPGVAAGAEWFGGLDLYKQFRPIYRRGFVVSLRCDLADWLAAASAMLATHPIERVEIADVPGLTFEVRSPDATESRWLLIGRRLGIEVAAQTETQLGLSFQSGRMAADIASELRRAAVGDWQPAPSALLPVG